MKRILFNLFFVLILSSCTSQSRKSVNDEIKELKGDFNSKQVNLRYEKMVKSSKRLNEKQKRELLNLHLDVLQKTEIISKKINKLKIISFRYLTEKEYDSDIMEEIKIQLKAQNKKKTKILNNADSRTREILGVNYQDAYSLEDFRDLFHHRM